LRFLSIFQAACVSPFVFEYDGQLFGGDLFEGVNPLSNKKEVGILYFHG
jgi:hypothetical protein